MSKVGYGSPPSAASALCSGSVTPSAVTNDGAGRYRWMCGTTTSYCYAYYCGPLYNCDSPGSGICCQKAPEFWDIQTCTTGCLWQPTGTACQNGPCMRNTPALPASYCGAASSSCPCNLPWGGTIQHGQTVTTYSTSSVACGSTCQSETRTCNNGTLSGTYTSQSCTVDTCSTCTPCVTYAGKEDIEFSNQFPNAATRSCWDYTHPDCRVEQDLPMCDGGGPMPTPPAGWAVCGMTNTCCSTAQPTQPNPFIAINCTTATTGPVGCNYGSYYAGVCDDSACASAGTCAAGQCHYQGLCGNFCLNELDTVTDPDACGTYLCQTGGVMQFTPTTPPGRSPQICPLVCELGTGGGGGSSSGSSTSSSSSSGGGASCTLPWGGTMASGLSTSAYQSSSVACGSSCVSELRNCTNGTLSGSYTNQSCSAAICPPAAACNLPWGGTLASGGTVTAFQSSAVGGCGSCTSQVRTCTNGVLSGTYTYPTCTVTGCGSSTGGGGGCFTGETMVLMADGSSKRIDAVKIGDKVKGQAGTNTIQKVLVREVDYPLYAINGGTPFITAEHPVWTPEGWKSIDPEKTFKETVDHMVTKKLAVGDVMLMADGSKVAITALVAGQAGKHTVYNINLDGDHTYYANGILVHNPLKR